MLDTVLYVCGILWLISWLTYFLPQLYVKYASEQNLKVKYNAEWAMVTGGSSGIGRGIVEKLAGQGINVVVVAYPDQVLDKSVEEYEKEFSACKFRKIGLNLADPNFMETLIEKTKDIKINIVANNAGFITTSFFANKPVGAHLANHDVNATSVMKITHHYVSEMQLNKLPGCVFFTSSPAGFLGTPFSVIYGSTKAYVSEFAASIAPEIKGDGIDVCVVHPSPIASRFYDDATKIDAIKFFMKTTATSNVIADALFRSVGRVVTVDQGYYPLGLTLILKIIDKNFLNDLIWRTASAMPDFKAIKAQELKK